MENLKEKVSERNIPFINFEDFDDETKKKIYLLYNSNDNKTAGVSIEDYCAITDKIYLRVKEWLNDDPSDISDSIQQNAQGEAQALQAPESATTLSSADEEVIQAESAAAAAAA